MLLPFKLTVSSLFLSSIISVYGITKKGSINPEKIKVPPIINGVLDDSAWQNIVPISTFTQVTPDEGAEPSLKTELYLCYDDQAFYVGFRCNDPEPEKLIARKVERDSNLGPDDNVAIVFSPLNDKQNGYFFLLNPRGTKRDGLIRNGKTKNSDWDNIWEGKAKKTKNGWVAEFAIPYHSLSLDPSQQTWGFNAERQIARLNETVRWQGIHQEHNIMNIAYAGELHDIEINPSDKGIEIKPSLFARYTHNRETGNENDTSQLTPSLDLFYKLTQSNTLALTFNTDFAETEVDDVEINLSQYPLFFPEKRTFFLQDANVFNFSGISKTPIPYYSRRIGLDDDGNPVDIIYGIKFTGQWEGLHYGIQSIKTDDSPILKGSQLSVARITQNIGEESSVGIIATNGNAIEDIDNSLLGVDLNIKNSHFNNQDIEYYANYSFQQSYTEDVSEDESLYYMTQTLRNEYFKIHAKLIQAGEAFNPGLGFIRRPGERLYELNLYRTYYPNWIHTVSIGTEIEYWTLTNGQKSECLVNIPSIQFQDEIGNTINFDVHSYEERIFEAFEIWDDHNIPVGTYSYYKYTLNIDFSNKYPFDPELTFRYWDNYYEGKRKDVITSLDAYINEYMEASLEYKIYWIETPFVEFEAQVASLDLIFNITSDINLRIKNQWDNDSQEYHLNARLRWIVSPGNELFLVSNYAAETSEGWTPYFFEAGSKLGLTWRF